MAQMIEEYHGICGIIQRFVNENPDFYAVYDVLGPEHSFNHTKDDMFVLRVYKWPHRDKENKGDEKNGKQSKD